VAHLWPCRSHEGNWESGPRALPLPRHTIAASRLVKHPHSDALYSTRSQPTTHPAHSLMPILRFLNDNPAVLAGAAILSTLVAQNVRSSQDELAVATLCWPLLSLLFRLLKISGPPPPVGLRPFEYQGASSRSLWIVSASFTSFVCLHAGTGLLHAYVCDRSACLHSFSYADQVASLDALPSGFSGTHHARYRCLYKTPVGPLAKHLVLHTGSLLRHTHFIQR
jgi:hypothetical protein